MLSTPTFVWAALLSGISLVATAGTASAQHGHGHGHGGHGHGHGHGGHGHGHGHGHYHGGHHHHGSFGFYGYAYPRSYYSYGYGYPYYGGTTYYAPQYYVQPAPTVVNYPPSATVETTENIARIEVRLPVADAQVWIEGRATTSRSLNRLYESPELTPGKSYSYTMKATWTQDGQPVTQERQVSVAAGQASVVDFTRTPAEKIAPPR